MARELTRVSKGMIEGKFGEVDVSRIDANGILELTVDDGQHITLTGHGAADFEITGFGDKLPVGSQFTLLVPRTTFDSSADGLGNYVQFIHTDAGSGIDLTINRRTDGSSELYTYQCYPNFSKDGINIALYEAFSFVSEGSGRVRCTRLPSESTHTIPSWNVHLFSNGRLILGSLIPTVGLSPSVSFGERIPFSSVVNPENFTNCLNGYYDDFEIVHPIGSVVGFLISAEGTTTGALTPIALSVLVFNRRFSMTHSGRGYTNTSQNIN